MKPVSLIALAIGSVALVATIGWPMAARAAQASDKPAASQPVPKGWNYEIKNGQRVPKGNRVTNADGSTREEIRQGTCVTIKERSATGEFKQTTDCD